MKNALNEIGFALRNQVLGRLKIRSGNPNWSVDPPENLFYRNLILHCKSKLKGSLPSRVWDVGAKNGVALPHLAEAFPSAALVAVEVDGKRRYANGYFREDYLRSRAEALRKLGRDVEVRVEDFRVTNISSRLDLEVFFFIFPFVSEDPCLAWGLPKEFSKYDELVQKVDFTQRGRLIVSVHQGNWEKEAADLVYRTLGLAVVWSQFNRSEIPNDYPQKHEIFVAVVAHSR